MLLFFFIISQINFYTNFFNSSGVKFSISQICSLVNPISFIFLAFLFLSTTTGSTGGNTTISPIPPAQNVCDPNEIPASQLGNSGMVFDTHDALDAYGWEQVFNENSPWYGHGWYAWTVSNACGDETERWTIDFYPTRTE